MRRAPDEREPFEAVGQMEPSSTEVVRRRGRALPRLVVILLTTAALVAVAADLGVFGAGSSSVPFQAGYVWCCGAREADATWVVPPLVPAERIASESAWVGVQTGSFFFFQAGTIEQLNGNGGNEFAFWSDGAVKYEPQPFYDLVSPGDRIHVRIRLVGSRWVAVIRDLTAGWSDAAAVHAPAGESSDAEWIDEDPVVQVGGRLPTSVEQVTAMPHTTCALTFSALHVNGRSPATAALTGVSFVDADGSSFDPRWNPGTQGFTVRGDVARHRLAAC